MSEPAPVLPATEEVAERAFTADGHNWIARLAGEGLTGTGHLGLGRITLVQFYVEGEPAPRSEALIPAGRFQELFEAELASLLARAAPVRG